MQTTSAEPTIREVGIVNVTFGKGVTVVDAREPLRLHNRRRQLCRPIC